MHTHIFSNIKKSSLLILGITAVVFSRTLFFFFDDPEGPNLLVVMVTAAILYVPSLAIYAFSSSAPEFKRLSLTIFIQILLVVALYFLALKF